MKTRIEQDADTGDMYVIIPEDYIEELQLDIGHPIDWYINEDNELVLVP